MEANPPAYISTAFGRWKVSHIFVSIDFIYKEWRKPRWDGHRVVSDRDHSIVIRECREWSVQLWWFYFSIEWARSVREVLA